MNAHEVNVDVSETIKLENDIYFELTFPPENGKKQTGNDDEQSGTNNNNGKSIASASATAKRRFCNCTGRVYSYKRTVSQLVDYLKEHYHVIENFMVPKIDKIPNVSNLTVVRLTSIENKVLKGDRQDFIISKNMENIFLESNLSERLQSHIARFDDRMWYAKRGIPRNLGSLITR